MRGVSFKGVQESFYHLAHQATQPLGYQDGRGQRDNLVHPHPSLSWGFSSNFSEETGVLGAGKVLQVPWGPQKWIQSFHNGIHPQNRLTHCVVWRAADEKDFLRILNQTACYLFQSTRNAQGGILWQFLTALRADLSRITLQVCYMQTHMYLCNFLGFSIFNLCDVDFLLLKSH